MKILPLLKTELEEEYMTTRKFFAKFPEDKNDYAPHEKSMKMMALASHIADVFGWPPVILTTEVLDFAKDPFSSKAPADRNELLLKLEEEYKKGMDALAAADEEKLEDPWSLANDGHVITTYTKYSAIRHGLNQVTHHRAQLGVYFRLLGIALPGSYGPSADDQSF